ncbi:MAG: hypothetical protein M3Q47_12525 [Actinomycetota bacterium]|nr:hypothetical protein [Actinomycetota bacterium]
MDLKRPVVVLALAGALAGCGSNSNLDRGEGECNGAEAGANERQLCEDAETDNQQQTDQEDDGTG